VISAADVIACARLFLGTPYAHQGRVIGHGVDCAGLVICVAHKCGLSSFDLTSYGRQPDPGQMLPLLREHLDLVRRMEMRPGDVLSFAYWQGRVQHLGILVSDDVFIHAIDGHGCIEQRLSGAWAKRLRNVYRFPGLTDGA
jgi:NlpC/P60 family putative phage cell wall peptidase